MQQGATPHREAYYNAVQTLEMPDDSGRIKYVANRRPRSKPYQKKVNGMMMEVSEAGASTIRITQSYLRSEIVLNQALTSYNFGILNTEIPTGSNGLFPTEQRLKQQDVFFTYSLGFFVLCASTGSGNTEFQYELMTFPNPNFFGSPGLNLDLMAGLWNTGQLQVSVNNDVLTPAWNLSKHYYASRTQIITSSWPSNSPWFNDQLGDTHGYVTVEPNWILNGGNNNQYVINYPQSLTSIGIGTNASFRLVLIWNGFLAQNASSIMDNK